MVAEANEPPAGKPTSILIIDGTNFDFRLSDAVRIAGQSMRDVDFLSLFDRLSDGTDLRHVHFCSAPYKESRNPERSAIRARQVRTFNRLRKANHVTLQNGGRHVERERICGAPKCGWITTHTTEKGTDVAAASQLIYAAATKQADRLIFVANDNDFLPAFQICRKLNVHLTFGYVKADRDSPGTVNRLRELATKTIPIDVRYMSKLWLDNPAREPGSSEQTRAIQHEKSKQST